MAFWQDKLIAWADECEISPEYFPRDKKALENLKELDLSFCSLDLPNELANLQKLEKLSLYGNNFKEFPSILRKLKLDF